MNKVKRAAIYIRVSTSEQAIYGKSLQAQREFLSQYATTHDMSVVGTYADEGQSARKELKKRKAIHKLLDDVMAEKIDIILFWKMDRWFRSVSDFYKVQDILDAHNVEWIAAAEPNINMNTRDGRLNLNIMLSIGQNEVDTTSERIRFTVDNMIRNGRIVWGKCNLGLGYTIESGKVVKDKDTSHMVEEFYNYFRTHQNKRKTVRHMQEIFGIDFSYSMLRTMLTSEFYIGKYRENDSYCPAYLTQEDWDEIQKISKKNIRQNRSGRTYYFAGLIRCPKCAQLLSGTGCSSIINRKTGEKRTYCYYRCNRAIADSLCSNKHRVSQNLLEQYLLDNLELEFKKFEIRQHRLSEKKKNKKKMRTMDAIQEEMKRLNTIYQRGRMPYDEYEEQYQKLEKELNDLTIIPITAAKDYFHIKKLLSGNFRNVYTTLDSENKRAFWRNILFSINLDDNNEISTVDFL